MNKNHNNNNCCNHSAENQCGCPCPPPPAPMPPVDINMSVCDRNINMLPMLQTYTTKVLKPNIDGCCKKNILKQCMMNCENYKYVIKWDFDLNGETITVPENCILEFDGGSLKNGTIIGQDTVYINVGDVDIWGENLTREGTWREHSGGGEQVQSDWNQEDSEASDYIKNKPSIYTRRESDNKFQPKGSYAPASDTDRIVSLEEAVDVGGSIDQRIASVKSEIIGDATSSYDTLGKIQSKLTDEQTERAIKDLQHDAEISNRYTKGETNNIISRTPETDVIVVNVYRPHVSILGDSISTFNQEGYKIDGYDMWYPHAPGDRSSDVTNVSDTWWKKTIDAIGGIFEVNASCAGSTASTYYVGFSARVSLLGNPDIIFISLGTNDSVNNIDIGTIDYSAETYDLSKFAPAFVKGMQDTIAAYPAAKIVCMAFDMGSSYSNVVQTVAEHYGALYINVGDISDVHPNKAEMEAVANRTITAVINEWPHVGYRTIDIIDALNEIAVADRPNKLFRVPGPTNQAYSEWAWDGSDWVMLANKDYGIDNEPIQGSTNVLGSGAAASVYGYYTENPEFIRVFLDKEGRIIDGIRKDGSRIKDDYKVDKEEGKGLIDSQYASANRTESSPEFLEVYLDSENRIIASISKDGQVSIPKLASPKIDALANEINALTEKLLKPSKGAGNYLEQKKYALNVFRNTEASQTYYRKDGNIWVNDDDRNTTINPITDYDAADPSYIQVGDYFYLFKTGKHCRIDRSKDLVNWEENYSQVFPDDFDYSIFPNFVNAWANDINCIDGRYVDYIAIWAGDNDKSYTIVMYATNIEGPWTYGGVMCPSKNNGGPVSQPIDPEYVTDGVNGYLIVGCFRDLYMAQTSSDGLHIVGEWIKIARGIYNIDDDTTQNHCGEGSYVYKYKGYYYLFVSLGRYGDYTYRVAIARSSTLDANFVNKNGENLLNADATVILHSDEDDTLYGPGHNGEIYEDGDGNMYIILHSHVRGMFSSEETRPAIMMRIVEGNDGWLAFADMDGNVVTKPTWATGLPVII